MKFFFVIIALSVATPIACSTSRSATSPTQPTDNPTTSQSSRLSSSSVQEQTGCSLKMSQAPAVKGLKLGMTPDEVLERFPGSKDDPELRSLLSAPPSRFGTASLLINPEKYQNKADFSGIRQITFTLLDSRVSNFTVNYNGPEWPHVDKFVEQFVRGTSLPPADQWESYVGLDNQMKTLICADFSIRAFIGGEGGNLNYVLIQDLEGDRKLKERRKKAREQASPTPGG